MKYDRIYISGKITGVPDLNKPKFQAAEEFVFRHQGFVHDIVNPHKLPDDHDKTWSSYMKECIKALCTCQHVVVLDDWEGSRGAITEVLIAKILQIPVWHIETMAPLKISVRRLLCKLFIMY